MRIELYDSRCEHCRKCGTWNETISPKYTRLSDAPLLPDSGDLSAEAADLQRKQYDAAVQRWERERDAAPEGLREWLVYTCECGYAYATPTRDAEGMGAHPDAIEHGGGPCRS